MQEKVISLGKQLIEGLGAEPAVDMLSRWMAHYVAQQIVVAENATGAEKAAAEECCFRTVLSLWEHRATLPNGCRPFEAFEPIFETLARLHPDEGRPFYLSSQLIDDKEEPDPVKSLIKLALAADVAARAVLDVLVAEATEQAISGPVLTYLENALSPSLVSDIRASDVRVIVELRERATQLVVDPQAENEAVRKIIESRIEKLDAFAALCQFVRSELAKQLNQTNDGSKSEKT